MSDARGGRFYVLDDGAEPIHEDDLTPSERATLGLPPLPNSSYGSPQDSPHVTEEVGSDG